MTWPAADVGGIPPEGGIEAAYKRQLAEAADPAALRAELEARIESARGPVGPLNKFQIEEMIDPRDTRRCSASGWRTRTGWCRSRRGWGRGRCSSGPERKSSSVAKHFDRALAECSHARRPRSLP